MVKRLAGASHFKYRPIRPISMEKDLSKPLRYPQADDSPKCDGLSGAAPVLPRSGAIFKL